MRVLPNLYPAFDGDEPFSVHHLGPVHVEAEASGIHEVFVFTPRPRQRAARPQRRRRRRSDAHAASAASASTPPPPTCATRRRSSTTAARPGASLAHPHGQLLGLPFVPGEILEEQRAFSRFEGGCILCATVEAELVDGKRVVFANDDVVCVCPFWSGSPYEMMVIPRNHDLHLTDSDDDIAGGHRASPSATRIARLHETLGDVAVQRRASTPRRTTTAVRSTGTCTSGRSWSPRPASSGAPAC